MRDYPQEIEIAGKLFRYEKILKEDFFSINVLYRADDEERYVLKLSDFRFAFGTLLRPLAGFFSKREYAIYRMVTDIEGIPKLGPRYGTRGYFHLYIEGKTLHEVDKNEFLPEDFFDRLKAIIEELHKRRIFYLDLNKRGNIIVSTERRPYLIDFQVSMVFPERPGLGGLGSLRGRISDRLFRLLIREDMYHLYKHKKKYQPALMAEEEHLLARRTGFNLWYDRLYGTPYRKIKRLIYPSGSNEIIWYKWKKMKDKTTKGMP